jgi:hypothetical protein
MNPNQRIRGHMNRSPAALASLGLVVALAPLACSSKVLSFDPASTSAQAEVVPGQSIASLTDTQAGEVCAWLAGSYSPVFVLPIRDSTTLPDTPGYLSGPGYSFMDERGTAMLTWVALAPQSACVANLRHSACAATVASLEQCVQYFQSHPISIGDGSYGDAMTACAAFEGAAGCDETVFHLAQQATPDTLYLEECFMMLPVAPGATCPIGGSGSTDGGTE